MKKITFTLLGLILLTLMYAQDTLTIEAYNLTNYGNYTSYCTEDNNNMSTKTDYIKTIVSYTKPDIFGAVETKPDADVQDYLLNNAFILNGFPRYKRSETVGSYLMPQLYYDGSKVIEKGLIGVDAYPRPIVIHELYFNTRSLKDGDTTWLYLALAHLKAGNTSDDSTDRAQAIKNFMSKIESLGLKNYIIMGDFNVYTSAEGAYQGLTNPSNSTYKFSDPGPAGNWHENSDYAAYHTQSTNYSSNGCLSGGGLDDRFDFILYSSPLLDGSQGAKILPSTFKVVGNDGKHFNSSVDYNGNTSVPSAVLTALKNNSDHLPVTIKIVCLNPLSSVNDITTAEINDFQIINTAVQNELRIKINVNKLLKNKSLTYKIINESGQTISTGRIGINPNNIKYTIPVSNLQQGFYILQVISGNKTYAKKFIKL